MPPSEGETININRMGETKFTIGYYFGEEAHDVIIKIEVDDVPIHLRPDMALGLAMYLIQAAHRADTISYAVHAHQALTHNDSSKRKSEFIRAVNELIEREELNARATVSSNGD